MIQIYFYDFPNKLYDDVALKIKSKLKAKPDSVLGLAAGSTPIPLYQRLIQMYKNKEISFKDVHTFNLDEYYPLAKSDPHSFNVLIQNEFLKHINIKEKNRFSLDGSAKDPEHECERYEKLLKKYGGIDLQILGIGTNGHIAFNEPGSTVDSKTRLVNLAKETTNHNPKLPKQGLTMGIATILKAREILLIAVGKNKEAAVQNALNQEVSANNPTSYLQLHSKTEFYLSLK